MQAIAAQVQCVWGGGSEFVGGWLTYHAFAVGLKGRLQHTLHVLCPHPPTSSFSQTQISTTPHAVLCRVVLCLLLRFIHAGVCGD